MKIKSMSEIDQVKRYYCLIPKNLIQDVEVGTMGTIHIFLRTAFTINTEQIKFTPLGFWKSTLLTWKRWPIIFFTEVLCSFAFVFSLFVLWRYL